MNFPVLQPRLSQAGPHLLAAGGQHVMVQLHLLLMRESDIFVKSWLDCSCSWIGPASPEVDSKDKADDELPHSRFSIQVRLLIKVLAVYS